MLEILQTLGILTMLAEPASPPATAFAPTSSYTMARIGGYEVLWSKRAVAEPALRAEVQREMERQFQHMHEKLPAPALQQLRAVRVWVELDAKPNGAAEFHVDRAWLRDNGYNPEKVGGIEINNMKNFIAWSRDAQPCMLLHEMAHAYHHRVLGEHHAGIANAFEAARSAGLYASVAHVKGGRRRAYALTNHKEYFAEASEAYFGRNDFFPFDRDELKAYDPRTYTMLEQAWSAAKPSTEDADAKQKARP